MSDFSIMDFYSDAVRNARAYADVTGKLTHVACPIKTTLPGFFVERTAPNSTRCNIWGKSF